MPSNQTRAPVRPKQSPRRPALILAAVAVPILVAVGVAAVLVGGTPASTGAGNGEAPPSAGGGSALPSVAEAPTGSAEVRLIYPDSPTKGPADAKVTLVEFLDPECESCRAAHPLVKQLLAEYEGRIRYVVRYVPGHANSALAVAALEEAGRQGRYWEMLDLLFARQPEWGERSTPQTAAFLAYGRQVGLDVDALTAALESPDLRKVERDAADARALAIRGTPTFFINGVVLADLSETGLRSMIDAASR